MLFFLFLLKFTILIFCSNIKIVTFVNHAYENLLVNFVCNLKILNIYKNLHVFISDKSIENSLKVMNIPYTYLTFKNETSDSLSAYGEQKYWDISRKKVFAFYQAALMFSEYIFSDVDILWLNVPFNNLKESCMKDICFQYNNQKKLSDVNSGFFYAKSSNFTKSFFLQATFYETMDRFKKLGDQDIVNFLLLEKFKKRSHIGMLNIDSYPNGARKNYWNFQIAELKAKYPNIYVLHNNWIISKQSKIERFKRANAWFIGNNNICAEKTV